MLTNENLYSKKHDYYFKFILFVYFCKETKIHFKIKIFV